MCGFPLRAQQPVAAAPVHRNDPPLAVNSFSILGLQDGSRDDYEPSRNSDPGSNIDYLLEDDEPESSHRGTYVTLLFLAVVIAVVALAWNWQRGAFEPTSPSSRTPTRPNSVAGEPPAAPTANAVANETTLPPSSRQTASKSPSVVPPNSVSEPAVVPEKDETAPAQPPQDQGKDSPNARVAAQPTGAPARKPRPGVSQTAARPSSEVASDDNPPIASTSDSTISTSSPAAPRQARQPAPSTDSQLFAEGENYLYGDGVVKDCDRAQKNLRVAAGHSYPPAESLLGTMYASGHCVGRDLPMAYRWYARALHHDPANARIQSDLEVLWKQMTPAEKRATQHGE